MLDLSRLREEGLISTYGSREMSVHHGREGVARGTGENLPCRIRRKVWYSLQRPDLRGLLASV